MLDILLEFILEHVGDFLESLGDVAGDVAEGALEAGGALLAGGAIAAIAYTTYTTITSSNLAEKVREAILYSKDAAFKELVGKSLTGIVKEAENNTVTLEVFEADVKEEERKAAKVSIKSAEGIDNSIRKGQRISIPA